jgi:hypothetical protein
MAGFWERLLGRRRAAAPPGSSESRGEAKPAPSASTASPSALTPDLPSPFGFKINWFAIKTTDGPSVAEVLGLTNPRPANWASGIKAAYRSSPITVFVSPPVEGWTFVVGAGLPYPADGDRNGGHLPYGQRFRTLFGELSRRFETVQFFGSDRRVDFSAWAWARDGKTIRVFSYVGSDGEVLANEGVQTPEESALGLIDPGARSPADATDYLFEQEEALMEAEAAAADEDHEDNDDGDDDDNDDHDDDYAPPKLKAFPGEDDVIDLAGLWSLDPYKLEKLSPEPALGWLGELSRE